MNHPPKQLALLISLIGGGISPYAQARIDEHRVDLARALPDLVCTELDAVALPGCAATGQRDLVWQPQRSALDLRVSAGVLVLYGAPGDDWAPGEMPGHAAAAAVAAAPPPARLREPAVMHEPALVHEPAAQVRRVRVLAPIRSAPHAQRVVRAKADVFTFERVAQVRPEPFEPAPVSAGSIEVERLLANLAAVLAGEPATNHLQPAPIAASETPGAPRLRTADPASLDHAAIAVETQADKVLRQLGAIVSDESGAPGVFPGGVVPPVVATHSEKVMAMLGQVSSTSAPAAVPTVEDGPAKRLRKLAARAARAQAAPPEAPSDEVDVLLPLTMPALAALPAGSFAELPHLAVQQPPPVAAAPHPEPGGAGRANPFGDRRVAVSEGSLDRVRGGYAGEGLNISFGIERAVYINGALVTTTSLNVSDLGQVSAGRGAAALDSGTIALIQNGAGNVVAGGSISSSAMGTIVQNTLDGQKIQNVTTINATANSLGLFRTLNLQSSLRGAVIDSLRR